MSAYAQPLSDRERDGRQDMRSGEGLDERAKESIQAPLDRPSDQSLDDLLAEVQRFEAVISSWEDSPRGVALALRSSVDALNRAALRKLIAGVKAAPGAQDALRAAASDPLVYAVLRHHCLIQPSQQELIERALASVRPSLASHGGGVEFVAFVPPDAVEVRFLGNCDGCSASNLTFVAGVQRAIHEHCPDIKHVRQVKGMGSRPGLSGFISPFAKTEQAAWRFATELDAIPDGGILACDVDGSALLFSRSGGVVACFHDSCAHLGLKLSGGAVARGRIICPHHGFEYDLMSGECRTAPEVQLRAVPVRVIGGRADVQLVG